MGGSVEQPELHRAFLEHRVKIQTVVPAVIIMDVAAAFTVVPDTADLLQRPGLSAVQFLQKPIVHRLAPSVLSGHRHLKRLVDQILLGSHNVGDVPQGVGIRCFNKKKTCNKLFNIDFTSNHNIGYIFLSHRTQKLNGTNL